MWIIQYMTMKSSQAISMDVMVAIVIFVGAIFFIYAIFNAKQGDGAKELEEDASKVLKSIASEDPDVGIVEGIEIDEAKLQQLLGKDYDAIKQQIRADKDFCIFIEDENWGIVYLSPSQPGIGSSKIRISGVACG